MVDFSQVTDIKINGLGVKSIFYHRVKDATNYNRWYRPYAFPLTVIGVRYNCSLGEQFTFTAVKDKHGCVIKFYKNSILGKDLDNLSRSDKLIYSEINKNTFRGAVIRSSLIDYYARNDLSFPTIENILDLSAYYFRSETEYQDWLLTLFNQEKGYLDNNDTKLTVSRLLMSGTNWELTGWGNILLDDGTDFSNETLFSNKILVWPMSTLDRSYVDILAFGASSKYDVARVDPDDSNSYIMETEPFPNCYLTNESNYDKYLFKLDEKVRIIDTTSPLITLSRTSGTTTTITSSRSNFSDYISKYDELTDGKYKREDYPYLVGVQQLRIKNPSLGINYGARFPVFFIADR